MTLYCIVNTIGKGIRTTRTSAACNAAARRGCAAHTAGAAPAAREDGARMQVLIIMDADVAECMVSSVILREGSVPIERDGVGGDVDGVDRGAIPLTVTLCII